MNVKYHSYRPDEQLLFEMSSGGFGLVWMDEGDKNYQKLYCPYKLGTFIAAGIPVIVQRGFTNQEIIDKNGLGLVVDSLDEAIDNVNKMTFDEYQAIVSRVRLLSPLVREGFFLSKRY